MAPAYIEYGVSLDECRQVLGARANGMTDRQVARWRRNMYSAAHQALQAAIKHRRRKRK